MLRTAAIVVGMVVFGIASTLWIASGANPEIRGSKPGDPLAGGFVVAPHTQRVGPEFPGLDRTGEQVGSTVVFEVATDAASAMRSYVRQAQQLGYRQTTLYQQPICRMAADLEWVKCQSSAYRVDGRFVQIDVTVCRACPEGPISLGRLQLYAGVGRPPPELEPITDLASDASSARLSAEEMARMHAQLGSRSHGEHTSGFVVHPGSELATLPTEFGYCQPDLVTVLRVTGDPEKVLDAYATSLFREDEQPVVRTTTNEITVTERGDHYWGLKLVEDANEPASWLLVNLCSD